MEYARPEKYIDIYKDVKALQPFAIRSLLRNMALSGLALKNKLTGIENYLTKPRVQFLYIHHIFKDELMNFENLLSELSRHHTFISYSDAVNKVLTGTIDKPYISISSDDGFKSNLLAMEALKKYNASACFFINPGLIGETDFSVIKKHCKERLNFPPVEFLSWKDVETLQNAGHEIGSHTMTHMDIAKSTHKEINEDMHQTFEILKNKCGSVAHFAFPYGRFFNFNEMGRKAVFDAGFTSCATAERGCHIKNDAFLLPENFCIRRDHVVLDWNMNHILYFIANNAKNATVSTNLFPY